MDTTAEKGNKILRIIQNHYGNIQHKYSTVQNVEDMKILGLRFRRWYCMPAGVVVQFCVGSVYAWSVFNKPLDNAIDDFISNRSPITFTIAIALLGLSAAIMGPWMERNGPRSAALLGTILFFAGNLLTALAVYLKQMWLVWLGYGLIGGAGIGLCYICPVSTLQKWFPDRRGLASGIAVSGFGAGSIAMAKIQVIVMDWVGLAGTFLVLGGAYAICMLLAAFVLRNPPQGFYPGKSHTPEPNITVLQPVTGINSNGHCSPRALAVGKDEESCDPENSRTDGEPRESQPAEDSLTLLNALTSTDFRLMYVAFLANIMFGLVLISRLSNMITDIFGRTSNEAATIVSINGGFNLAGRLVFSTASDYIGRKNCYVFMLFVQLVVLGVFSTLTTSKSYYLFLASMWVLTSCYGAGFSVIPAFLSDKFGAKNVGACHGVILTAWSLASVLGGVIFTLVFNHLSTTVPSGDPWPYNVNAWWLFGVVLIGWIAAIFVKPTKTDIRLQRCLCFWRGKKERK